MKDDIVVKCLDPDAGKRLAEEIDRAIAGKIKAGLLTEREIMEIEAMKLKPTMDILDVQSVYEDDLFKK